MKYTLHILEAVYGDLEEAGSYYHSQQLGLEVKLFDEWERTVQHILKAPEGYQKKRKNLRNMLLERFPYLIIYEIIDSTIVIYRFINIRRHPGKRYAKRK